jgi:hypothetical protein
VWGPINYTIKCRPPKGVEKSYSNCEFIKNGHASWSQSMEALQWDDLIYYIKNVPEESLYQVNL